VEHVERQDEREQELRSEVDDLEEQGDDLEEKGDRLEHQIDDARDEFESKKQSPEVPGAQDQDDSPTGTPPGDAAGGAPRTEEDE
jgi:chromosome segregation ATPase